MYLYCKSEIKKGLTDVSPFYQVKFYYLAALKRLETSSQFTTFQKEAM